MAQVATAHTNMVCLKSSRGKLSRLQRLPQQLLANMFTAVKSMTKGSETATAFLVTGEGSTGNQRSTRVRLSLVSPPSCRKPMQYALGHLVRRLLPQRLPLHVAALESSNRSQQPRPQSPRQHKDFTAQQGPQPQRPQLRLVSRTCASDHLRQQKPAPHQSRKMMRDINGFL